MGLGSRSDVRIRSARNRRRTVWTSVACSALVFGIVVLVATTCGPSAPAATTETGAPRGGTLTFALSQEPATLNPLYGPGGVGVFVDKTVIDGLVYTANDGSYVARLALQIPTVQNGGVKLSADGQQMDVTYKLRPGVVWSDGKPFSSADVKFTWERIMTDPKVSSRSGYDKIDAVDIPDDATVVAHYREIYAPYATLFDWILPKHVLDGVDDISKTEFGRMPIGTGPFRVVEFVSGDHITVERNPNYRVKGKPILDRIIFKIVPSREVALLQLKAGEVDGVWNLTEAQIPDLESDPSIKPVIVTNSTMERLQFNLSRRANPADPKVPHPVLSDLAVRRAINLATPKQEIIDKLLFGKAQIPGSYVTLGWAARRDLQQDGYDPAKSRAVLDQAGWKPGSDGIRAKDGVRATLEITTTTGDRLREQVEEVLVDAYKAVGVELTIKNYPSSVIFGSWAQNGPLKKGDFDIAMSTSGAGIDPHSFVDLSFSCKNIPQTANNGAGANNFRFCDPAVDKLIEAAGSTPDQEKRAPLYGEVFKAVNDNVLGVWLYTRVDINAFRSNVGGWTVNAWDGLARSAEDWYVRR